MGPTSKAFCAEVDVTLLRKQRVVWLGALSFEERCLGSLRALSREGVQLSSAVALDYPTDVKPRNVAEQFRASHRKAMQKLSAGLVSFRKTHPYRYTEFLSLLTQLVVDHSLSDETHLVVDITCLTKIHTLALAYYLKVEGFSCPLTLAYSVPEMYGSASRNIWGRGQWQSVIVTRLDLDSTHHHVGSDAVAIMGHEGDRLELALHEVQPDRTMLLLVQQRDTRLSGAATMTEIQNARLLEDTLKGMRPGYQLEKVDLFDPTRLVDLVSGMAATARKLSRRLVLCPFGPKPSVFYAGCAALDTFTEGTWLSYPVPSSYDSEYTAGCGATYWDTRDPNRTQLGLML